LTATVIFTVQKMHMLRYSCSYCTIVLWISCRRSL